MSVVSLAPAMLKDNSPSASPITPVAANEAQTVQRPKSRSSRVTLGDDGNPLYVRARAPEWTMRVFAMLCGIALFIGAWEILSKTGGGRLPDPVSTWHSAVQLFSDPFYRKGRASTLAVVKRETNSWKWPLAMFGYMIVLAYLAAFVVYQLARLAGFG